MYNSLRPVCLRIGISAPLFHLPFQPNAISYRSIKVCKTLTEGNDCRLTPKVECAD